MGRRNHTSPEKDLEAWKMDLEITCRYCGQVKDPKPGLPYFPWEGSHCKKETKARKESANRVLEEDNLEYLFPKEDLL